jgi:hypothetical protein
MKEKAKEFPDPDDEAIDELGLGSLALWVGDGSETDYHGKLEDLSLGGANLIFITLKLNMCFRFLNQ